MTEDKKEQREITIKLLTKSTIGIGVVFVALISTLPAAWVIEELREVYARYLSAVIVSLFAGIFLVLIGMEADNISQRKKDILIYIGVAGLALFAFATLYVGYRIARLGSL